MVEGLRIFWFWTLGNTNMLIEVHDLSSFKFVLGPKFNISRFWSLLQKLGLCNRWLNIPVYLFLYLFYKNST